MAAVDRTVRHLHLQAASAADARRAALRLEDALRCASLPDTGRRLLFVRRLELGRLRADASAQAWALGLEHALARAALRWLPGDAPGAGQADAVWFNDALHAHLALGLRLARGPAPVEWFWPRLLPAATRAPDATAALAAVLQALASLPESAAALPAWVAGMAQAGALGAVTAAVHRADAALLWKALGGRPGSAGQHGSEAQEASQPARAPWGAAETAIEADAPERAARALVAQALRLAGEAAHAQALEAPPHALSVHETTLAAGPRPRAELEAAVLAPVAIRAPSPDTAPPNAPGMPGTVEDATSMGSSARGPAAATPSLCRAGRTADTGGAARLMGEAWPWAQGQATAAGGVLFLVAMLERLGYPAWLQCLPEGVAQHCVAALWTRLFTRLALPATDPAWALALDAQGGPHALPPPADQQALVAIEARLRPARARRVAPWYGTTHQPTAAQALGERWLALARHGLRSRAGLGLHDLVMRPGWLLLTRTHADMVFDLHAVDLRVRRAGLDLNPGWVPWLGRVVGFHFERLPWLADAIGTNDA